MTRVRLSDGDYARLLALRTGLRHFERWSERQARSAGLTPAQHQLLLAVRGHGDARGPTIGEIADYLLLRHHSAVGLVDRADAAGLVTRVRDEDDHRVVRILLSPYGAESLETLSALHLEEIERLALELPGAWEGLDPLQSAHGLTAHASPTPPHDTGADKPVVVGIARVYDEVPAASGSSTRRVLVDRLWPRGIARVDAPFDEWLKEVAPSTQLRKWFGHIPERFEEFARRYRRELETGPASRALEDLRHEARFSALVLVSATRDLEHSAAAVLRAVLADTTTHDSS